MDWSLIDVYLSVFPIWLYVTQPYLISFSAAYMCQLIGLALVQIMACRLFGTKPLSEPMLDYGQLDP